MATHTSYGHVKNPDESLKQQQQQQGEDNDKRPILQLFSNRSLLISRDFDKRPVVGLTPPKTTKVVNVSFVKVSTTG